MRDFKKSLSLLLAFAMLLSRCAHRFAVTNPAVFRHFSCCAACRNTFWQPEKPSASAEGFLARIGPSFGALGRIWRDIR